MDNERLEKWKLKTKCIFHKITYDEFWFYIDDLMKENKKLTNNWNELEEWLQNEYNEWSTVDDEIIRAEARQCIEVLDKMKEIKGGNNVSSRD